jgi:hypothetical protein
MKETPNFPFSQIKKQYSQNFKLAALKYVGNPGFVTTAQPLVTSERTSEVTIDRIEAATLESIIDSPEKFNEANIAKVAQLSSFNNLVLQLEKLRKPFPGRNKVDAKNPLDWDHEPTFYQASTVAHGHILNFKQEWVADGYSLGELLYSLPLAPGQKKQIVVIDWERREIAERAEELTERESLRAALSHDRDINEIVNSTINESMRGGSKASTSSFAGGLGIGAILGPVGGVLGIGGGTSSAKSKAWQNSSRSLAANSLQSLRDKTAQSASAIRSQKSSVVQTVKQGERVEAQTEIVANYNHCHAITIQYFEILRHFKIRQRLSSVQECLFVPLMMSRFNRKKVLRWKDILESVIQKPKLKKGFGALARIDKNYEGSDLPLNRYADENVEYLEGDLKLRFQIARPRDSADDFEEPNWTWMGRLLPWRNAREFYENYLKGKNLKDSVFHAELGQSIAERFVKKLRFYAICNGSRKFLPIDATLHSTYRANGIHHVSLRMAGTIPDIKRKDIEYIQIEVRTSFGHLLNYLPTNSKVIVEGGVMRYRSKYLSSVLFNSSRIDNDLTGTDPVRIYTPLNRMELRNPREEDKEISKELIDHLNEHIEFYHRAIWWNMSPDRRYMLLDGFIAPNSGGKSIASVVENQPVGIIGNSLIMPVSPGHNLDPNFNQDAENPVDLLEYYQPTTPIEDLPIVIPTKGVFAEAVMGQCNCCEFMEEDRFWRWEESPIPDQPTPIQPVSTESRRAEPPDLTAKDFPTPMINLQNVPTAPDPTGLAAALQVLSTPNIFKDITGLTQNQLNALASLQSSLQTAQSFGQMASNLALQGKMTKDVDKAMKTIKEAKQGGLLSEEQAKELAGSAIRAQIGAGATPTKTKPREQKEVKSLIDTASEVVKKGDKGSQVEASLAGEGESLAIKISSAGPLPTEIAEEPEEPEEKNPLEVAKELAESTYSEYKYGDYDPDADPPTINCTPFIVAVVDKLNGGEGKPTGNSLDSTVINQINMTDLPSDSDELDTLVKNGTDERIKGIVYALVQNDLGEEISAENAKEGDFVQYWNFVEDDAGVKHHEGHAVIIENIVDMPNGSKKIDVYGSHKSTNGIGTIKKAVSIIKSNGQSLNTANWRRFVGRWTKE